MTYPPPPPKPACLNYVTPAKRGTFGLALVAMILGLCGVATVWFGFGVILGIVAVVVGWIAIERAKRDPARYGGKGFAIAAIWIGGFCALFAVPMIAALHSPGLSASMSESNRHYCAANLRGIAQSMVVYSAENEGLFPVTSPPATATSYSVFATVAPGATSEETLKQMYSDRSMRGDVTASLWILVLKQQCTPKQFLCKSDPNASAVASSVTSGNDFLSNFTAPPGSTTANSALSYSMAYPWIDSLRRPGLDGASEPVVGAWWRNTTDSRLPLMSDMAPMNGTGSSPVINVMSNATSNRAWNSGNHNRDGQEVVFGDVHVTFERTPLVGLNMDNIWTSAGRAPGVVRGTLGAPIEALINSFDTVMVPVRNVSTGDVQ